MKYLLTLLLIFSPLAYATGKHEPRVINNDNRDNNVIPILAIIFSGIGLAKVKDRGGRGKVQAWVGLILGVLYTLVNMYLYGHLG